VPHVDATLAKRTFYALHATIDAGLVRSCHDLSEGGLAVGAAEMAFAGGYGASIELERVAVEGPAAVALFSESNTRFLCEVSPERAADFEERLQSVPLAKVGQVVDDKRLEMTWRGTTVVSAELAALKEAWQAPLRW
jgi:phosphoribosylformylglycinamidine synthase